MEGSPRTRQRLPLRSRLVLFLSVCLVPATVLLGLQWIADLAQTRSELRKDAAEVVSQMGVQFSRDIAVASGIAQVMLSIDRSPAGLAQCPRLLADILRVTRESALNYALVAPSGEIICSGLPQANPPSRFDGRPYFVKALATGQPVISGQIFGRITGQSTVHLTVPHRNEVGVVDVVAVVAMDMVSVTANAARSDLVVMVLDASGHVVSAYPAVRNREPGVDARNSAIWPALLAGRLSGETTGLDGLFRYYTAQPKSFGGETAFWLVADVEISQLEASTWQRMRWHVLAGVLVSFATVLFALVGTRHLLLSRVQHLRDAATRIAGGGTKDRIPIAVQDELTAVETTFNSMLDELERQLNEARDREQRYRHLFDGNFDGVIESAPGGPVLQANAAAHRLLGYGPGELIGLRQADLVPADEPRVADLLARRNAEGAVRGELTMRRKDGTRLELEIWASLYRDSQGQLHNWMVLHDISERKRNEAAILDANLRLESRVQERTLALEAANRQLEQANGDLQSFAYSVSHDLKAPAAAIAAFSRYVLDSASMPEEKRHHFLTRIEAAANRMLDLIEAMLSLARVSQTVVSFVRVDLSRIATEVGTELAELNPQASVLLAVQPGIEVRGDPVLLRNVLANLLGNAWKFTRGQADPHVWVSAGPSGEDFVEVVVSDNGAGFDPAHASRLFRPFQRLHGNDEFPGVGIGLATVHRIIERHNGSIKAEGSPGGGARFTIRLPV